MIFASTKFTDEIIEKHSSKPGLELSLKNGISIRNILKETSEA